MSAVRCSTCGWKSNRKTDAAHASVLPKPCPSGHDVIVFNPPPSSVEVTPSGTRIEFWDSEDEATGLRQTRRYLIDGEKVDSVTQILGVLDKPGLTYWVAKQAYAGLDWEEERNRAGERGRQGHDLILRTILKERTSLADLDDEFRGWGQAAFRWLSVRRPEVVEAERMVAGSDYAGRFDLLATLRGLPGIPLVDFKTLTEWKSDNGKPRKAYAQNVIQLDLYTHAILESGYTTPTYGIVVQLGPDGTYREWFVNLKPSRGIAILHAKEAVADALSAVSSSAPAPVHEAVAA